MSDPIIFRKGDYEASGDGWTATAHVPHDIHLSQMMPAIKALVRERSRNGTEKDDAA